MYHKIKSNELPYPEAIFEVKYFLANPKPFFDLIKDLLPGNYLPTKAHYFIKLLQEKGILLRHYTQNIDNLERVTGISEDKLVEAHGIVKPDIVFYGEPLPEAFFQAAAQDFKKCDLLIIMGSSLQVEPFASLLQKVRPSCPRLLINKNTVGKAAGLTYDTPTNVRDVAWIENCDTACEILVEKLGWTDDWLSLVD
ncbi:hypothetical protein AAG570_006392 [Ranatra chinensis]|uniref:Deacetylase sirtuin-type domain-containing protein n=1 Tax=Ranatra chinensis TaxID=642074 RepID=A0ABD0ZAW9_9HEMI